MLKMGDDNMFTFTRESGLVKVWISLIMAGVYTLEQVPELFNLKALVSEILNSVA